MKTLRIDKNHENSKNKNNEKKRGRDKNGNRINTHLGGIDFPFACT